MNSIDLSPEALTRIKALAQKATPGPWIKKVRPKISVDNDATFITTEARESDALFEIARLEFINAYDGRKLSKFSREQRANAAFIAAAHPGVVLAMCEEIERLRDVRLNQVGEAAMSMLTEAITAVSDGKLNAEVKLGIECPYCGYESSSFEDAKAHDATCPKHPAVIRAARLEKEADWLAHRMLNCPDEVDPDGPWNVCKGEDCAGPSEDQGACWRRTARKAVEENNGSVL